MTITDSSFTPSDDTSAPAVGSWLAIDCGTQDVSGVTFRGNHCHGGAMYSGVGMFGGYSMSGLNIVDNDTDGASPPGGYFQPVSGTLASHHFNGNTSLGFYGFPNDPPTSNFPDSITLAPTALPATVTAGTIRFDGTHFYGGNDTTWKQLDNWASIIAVSA